MTAELCIYCRRPVSACSGWECGGKILTRGRAVWQGGRVELQLSVRSREAQ